MNSIFKTWIAGFLILCSLADINAQSVYISNSVMHIPSGASVVIPGGLTIANASGINNAGTVKLGGSWTNNANGLINASPGSVLLNGTSPQDITGTTPTLFNNLTIDNSSGVNLNVSTANINGTLNLLNGKVNTGAGSNTVVIGTPGNVIRTSGWVVGNLRKPVSTGNPTVTYEVGGTLYYTPLTQTFTGVATAGSYTARVIPGLHPNLGLTCFNLAKYLNQYWKLTRFAVSPSNFNVSFAYSSPLFVGSPQPTNFALGQYANASWAYPAISGTPTSTTLNAGTTSGDGEFAIAEGCIAPANDIRSGAIATAVFSLGSCNNSTGIISNATVSPESTSPTTTGEDLWYKFVAPEPGVRIQVASTSFNAVIELQNSGGSTLATENALAGTGTEILNFAGPLTVGQTYYVAVRNFNSGLGNGNFTICIQKISDTGCSSGPGPYTSCNTFKAINTNATSYTFTFTNTTTQVVTTLTAVGTTMVPLSSLPPGFGYNVGITANYNLFDGAGNPETIVIATPSACSMSMAPHADLDLRVFDQCPPIGNIRFANSVIGANTWLCGASFLQWEFTPVTPPGPAFTKNGPPNTRFLPLNIVTGIIPGTTYSVKVRPWFVNGTIAGNWGTDTQCLQIGTSGGMTPEGGQEYSASLRAISQPDARWAIYPNPSAGDLFNLNISGIQGDQVAVRIFDSTKRLTYFNRFATDGSLNQIIVFERPLNSGLYIVELSFDGRIVSEKLVIQN
jgi:hypothetical protein